MSDRRVVITGLGILSPLGNKIEQVWSSILKGESGVSEITSFDTTNNQEEEDELEIPAFLRRQKN